MMTALLVCVALLWVAVMGLIFVVLALVRQIGVLHERVAPVGALTVDQGPKVGELAPVMTVPNLAGGEIALGRPQGSSQMLFFLSPTCPVCKKLLPVLRSLSAAEPGLEIVLASDGELAEHRAFYDRERLAPFKYALSADLGMRYRIPRLPYAVLVSAEGVIRSKGLVNNREQLEGLLAAHELGVASQQEYRARALGADRPAAAAE
jgi:methylamine dehydrogenase accessory protein MauD